jgi:hypothetical protein
MRASGPDCGEKLKVNKSFLDRFILNKFSLFLTFFQWGNFWLKTGLNCYCYAIVLGLDDIDLTLQWKAVNDKDNRGVIQ